MRKRTQLYRKSFLKRRETFGQLPEEEYIPSPKLKLNNRSPVYSLKDKLTDFRGGSEIQYIQASKNVKKARVDRKKGLKKRECKSVNSLSVTQIETRDEN